MKLSGFTQGRDNNFNLIRMVAALAVLVTHSFALALGSSDAEPLRDSLGMTLGSFAVDVFFIASGFLVTASLLARHSVLEFVWSRCLRIFPALLVMLLLTVFGLGVFFTSLPLPAYLTDKKTYAYLVKCATLFNGVTYYLPGVFEDNPYRRAVNGSLWTMPYEVKMYAILAAGWAALAVIRSARPKVFARAVVGAAVASCLMVLVSHFSAAGTGRFVHLFFMFFSGAAFFMLREHIQLSSRYFWMCAIFLCAAALVGKQAFFVAYTLTVTYLLIFLAYVPAGMARKYNLLGDYSYGIYIYAFPVQQSIAALFPGVSVLSMIATSASATLLFAVLSWHLIEKRALKFKGLHMSWPRRQ